ncbi:MAG: HAD-IIB family hydrolase [Desulfobacter sp.]|nr:MAG: HAD-IIB family hydrolase [Desulfobacter sp.]
MANKNLYLQMFSVHGLLRGHNLELGYDADTGGQIKYVVELCRTLSMHPKVSRIDLFTRLISDKAFSSDYSRPVEEVNDKFRIVRIQCGGRKYIRKELLWPHLNEFVDKTIKFIQQEKQVPDIVHGHYPDAGYVAKELARFFGVPFVYTGHSMGRSKKGRLLGENVDIREMNRMLKIDHRIHTEETILKYTDLVITSTTQEIEGQYGLYKNRTLSSYRVIPPGIGIDKFYPYTHDNLASGQEQEEALFARSSLKQELNRFFQFPDKPMILVLCRPDKRKNIAGLVRAYGKDKELQAMANLAVFAGIRKDISKMEDNERDVLTRMLLLMDKYNLYGKMAIPKKHDFEHEVPELYRIAAQKKGVFVNPALTEPFGLTLLESLACGLPIVATEDGGPKDIMANCNGGILVDPKDDSAIAGAIRKIISDPDLWSNYSKNGIMNTRRHYTWENHAATYMETVRDLYRDNEASTLNVRVPVHSIGRRLSALDRLIITDIDNTLLGGAPKEIQKFIDLMHTHRDRVGFGVATGRNLDSAAAVLKEHHIPEPDIIISEVGSRINYGTERHHDKGWETHIAKNWKPETMVQRLEDIPFITPQEKENQSPYKLSYYMAPGKDRLPKIHHVLTKNRFVYTLIYSHEKYLDILPYRASKGKAIRYLSYKWEIPLKQFLVCGDSGNDEEMIKGDPLAVVVGNYSPELEPLRSARKIYFADAPYAGGILEGMAHYKFLEK